jgi:hypothetical protein
MRPDAERYYASNRGTATLYAGLLLPAAGWMLHLLASFTLATRLCDGRHHWILHVVLLVAVAMAVAGGIFSWRNWRGTGSAFDDDRGGVIGRSNFLAIAGLASAAFFGLVILLTEVPNWFLDPCVYG